MNFAPYGTHLTQRMKCIQDQVQIKKEALYFPTYLNIHPNLGLANDICLFMERRYDRLRRIGTDFSVNLYNDGLETTGLYHVCSSRKISKDRQEKIR